MRVCDSTFDKAYIDHEVAYHQAVIDAITNTLLAATQNADLKKLEVQVAELPGSPRGREERSARARFQVI